MLPEKAWVWNRRLCRHYYEGAVPTGKKRTGSHSGVVHKFFQRCVLLVHALSYLGLEDQWHIAKVKSDHASVFFSLPWWKSINNRRKCLLESYWYNHFHLLYYSAHISHKNLELSYLSPTSPFYRQGHWAPERGMTSCRLYDIVGAGTQLPDQQRFFKCIILSTVVLDCYC